MGALIACVSAVALLPVLTARAKAGAAAYNRAARQVAAFPVAPSPPVSLAADSQRAAALARIEELQAERRARHPLRFDGSARPSAGGAAAAASTAESSRATMG